MTRVDHPRFATILLASFFFFGCSTTDEGAQSVSEEDAPAHLGATVCEAWFNCDCQDFIEAFSSEDACAAEAEGEYQTLVDEAKAAGLTYDPACVGDLDALLDSLACEEFWDAAIMGLFDAPTDCLYYGEGEVGDACEVLGIEGGDDWGDDCAQDLDCIDGTCRSFDAQGDECSQDSCEAGLACVSTDGGPATCELLPAPGQTCLGAGNLCALDAYCDLESKNCVALPDAGQPCATVPNAVGLTCAVHSVCEDGQCTEGAGAGQPCLSPFDCEDGLTCDGDQGICVDDFALVCGALL